MWMRMGWRGLREGGDGEMSGYESEGGEENPGRHKSGLERGPLHRSLGEILEKIEGW